MATRKVRQRTGFQTSAGYVRDIHDVIADGREALKKGPIKDDDRTPVSCNLSASFGDLTKENFEHVDDSVKVMLSGSLRGMARLESLSWQAAMTSLMQNPLVEPVEGATINRSDKLVKAETNIFHYDSTPPSRTLVEEVKAWFFRLIQDRELLEDVHLDMEFFERLVEYAGHTVNLFKASLSTKEHSEKNVMDVTVLRYPDDERPFLMLYRIVVTAWRDGSRVLFVQEDKNGITGEFHLMKFRPRESTIEMLNKSVIEKAIREATSIVEMTANQA